MYSLFSKEAGCLAARVTVMSPTFPSGILTVSKVKSICPEIRERSQFPIPADEIRSAHYGGLNQRSTENFLDLLGQFSTENDSSEQKIDKSVSSRRRFKNAARNGCVRLPVSAAFGFPGNRFPGRRIKRQITSAPRRSEMTCLFSINEIYALTTSSRVIHSAAGCSAGSSADSAASGFP